MQPHPFLPGTLEPYVWLGLAIELVAFVALWIAGFRVFLTICLGLAILFIGYHALEAGLQIESPCPCLGGLLSRWRPLAQSESALSFLLACALGLASFVGLFPVSPSKFVAPSLGRLRISALPAMALWVLCGLGVVLLWSGRILGGDEGMEAAKSLQLLLHPQSIEQMWNDQPPLWSIVGALIFRLFGPSMTAGRIAVVFLGFLMPLVWAIYWSKAGSRWAALVSVFLLWLAVPSCLGSFMLEAPAYSVGTAAMLPLLIRGQNRFSLFTSVCIASLALWLKLTAAFALVVPFSWLLQRSWRRALLWGGGVLGLTLLGSLVLPGWSWVEMRSSHLNFWNDQIWRYHLDAAIYAQGWLICLLATFSLASRYVNKQLQPIVPWLSAAIVAMLIHLLHRPFWSYYSVHLIAPLAVLAGVGVFDLWESLKRASLSTLERRVLLGGTSILSLLWFWQQETQIVDAYRSSTVIASSPITAELKLLGQSGHTMFSMNPAWTFAAQQVQTPPELTVIPLKRVWSGQISDTMISSLLASNRVDAIVLSQDVLKQSAWTNLLAAYLPTAREGTTILFERRELNPHPIDLKVENETKVELGRLGL